MSKSSVTWGNGLFMEMMRLDLMRPNPWNPNRMDEETFAKEIRSIQNNGFVEPIKVRITATGEIEIIDGEHRWRAAQKVGLVEVPVVNLGKIGDAQAKKLTIIANELHGTAEPMLLANLIKDLSSTTMFDDLSLELPWTAGELEALSKSADAFNWDAVAGGPSTTEPPTGAPDKPNALPTGSLVVEVDIPDEIPKNTISKIGTIWTLGSSRLVCGDMTNLEVVNAAIDGKRPDMMWTDPPWNIAYDGNAVSGKPKNRDTSKIINDDLGEDFVVFVRQFVHSFGVAMDAGSPIYVAMSSQEMGILDIVLKGAGFHWSSTIIWAKQSLVISRKDFHPQYEPIWYGWREGAARKCSPSDRTMSDVWSIDRPRKSDLHPTMKPVTLVARSINASSKPGDLVFDPFCGSGTTLLAAEQTGRRAALVEMDPGYCDVIVERWQRLTGRKATKIG